MIRNRKQLAHIEKQIAAFQSVLSTLEEEAQAGYKKVLQGQIEAMEGEIEEYEDYLERKEVPVESVEDLPDLIVRAKNFRRMSQRELARRLGITPQQLSFHEKDKYRRIRVDRLLALFRILGISLSGTAVLVEPPSQPSEEIKSY